MDTARQIDTRSTVLRIVVQLALGALLTWWVVVVAQLDTRLAIEKFPRPPVLPIVFSVMFFGLSMILKAVQLRVLLPSRIGTVYLAGIMLSQNALLTFLPWRIGEASVPLLLRRHYDVSLQQSVPLMVMVRLCDGVIVMGVALCGGMQFGSPVYWAVALAGIAGLAILLVWAGRVRSAPTNRVLQSLRDAVELMNNPRRLAACVLLAALIFASTTFQSRFAIEAMGLPISVLDLALLNASSLLAALLPIHPPGGWGTIDSIQVAILSWLGYDAAIAFPAILAAHGFYTVVILLGGWLGWLLCRRGRNQ